MRKVLFIFGQLNDADVMWLTVQGHKQIVSAGSVLIHGGVPVDTLYIVLNGKLSVLTGRSQRCVAILGEGEIVGEMSFVDARPPSATVTALEDAVVFAVPTSVLRAALERDDGFAARFYRAVATYLSDRVRRATATEEELGTTAADELDDSVLDNIDQAGARFDQLRRTVLSS